MGNEVIVYLYLFVRYSGFHSKLQPNHQVLCMMDRDCPFDELLVPYITETSNSAFLTENWGFVYTSNIVDVESEHLKTSKLSFHVGSYELLGN